MMKLRPREKTLRRSRQGLLSREAATVLRAGPPGVSSCCLPEAKPGWARGQREGRARARAAGPAEATVLASGLWSSHRVQAG